MKSYFVYIMANWSNDVLYIGITGNLEKRVFEHKSGQCDGFTKKYNVNKLVYCEEYNDVEEALAREKQLKKWSRKKKDFIIEQVNPKWEEIKYA